jgi:hypothetical protein
MNSLLADIKKILWQDWDPIGIKAYSDPEDEYDTYASIIWINYTQYADFSEKFIYDYLMDIAQNYMGLSYVDSKNTLSVAKKIFDLCEKYSKSELDPLEIEKLKLLLNHPPCSDWTREDLYWDNDLSYACKSGNLKVFKQALDHGGNIQQTDNEGVTLLMFACYFGHIEIVKILLRQENPGIEYMDSKGSTALTYATKGKNSDIMQLILEESRTYKTKKINE